MSNLAVREKLRICWYDRIELAFGLCRPMYEGLSYYSSSLEYICARQLYDNLHLISTVIFFS